MTAKSELGSAYQAQSQATSRGGAEEEAPDGSLDFKVLSAHLHSILSRATMESWPGWTDDDTCAVMAAQGEIETFDEALAEGMRVAFALGRMRGKREVVQNHLDREIAEVSRRLAQEAWGPRPSS